MLVARGRKSLGALGLAVLAASVALGIASVASALATISTVAGLAGPSPMLRELGGVALAPDGTGGLAYRAVDPADGRAHVYAARFVDGRWFPPERVDAGQPLDSEWPTVGAASGGRLVVTWTQPAFQGQDRLWSATLPRGASGFQAPTLVDDDVRDATAGVYPSLAMNRSGQGLLAYRVVTTPQNDPSVGVPGYVKAEFRLARYDGQRWSVLPSRLNRNLNSPVRIPTATNGPQVAIDQAGNGVAVWQEPDDGFVDRIWARRIHGTRLGDQLLASPQGYGGRPLNGFADAPAVSVTPFSAATVAFRQAPGEQSALTGTRVFTNSLPDMFSDLGSAFAGALPAAGVAAGTTGAPSAAIGPDGETLLAYANGNTTFAIEPDAAGNPRPPAVLGTSSVAPDPQAVLGDGGFGAVAWREAVDRAVVQQRSGGRATASGAVAAPGGGRINALTVVGNGLGDALVAVSQGDVGADGRIVVAHVDAPPQRFGLHLPVAWQRKQKVRVRWEPAVDAFGVRSYTVLVDGRAVATTRRRDVELGPRTLPDGPRRHIRVIATDVADQRTLSATDTLQVDRLEPRVRAVRLGQGRVRIRIADPGKQASGHRRRGTVIGWGDGKVTRRARARSVHRYRETGKRVRITVQAFDKAGNRRTVRLRVRLRR